MFHNKPQNSAMPMDRSQGGTPKGVQSVQASSKTSSRGMSIALSNEMPLEIEKYDKFLIHVKKTLFLIFRKALDNRMTFMNLITLLQMRLETFLINS